MFKRKKYYNFYKKNNIIKIKRSSPTLQKSVTYVIEECRGRILNPYFIDFKS